MFHWNDYPTEKISDDVVATEMIMNNQKQDFK